MLPNSFHSYNYRQCITVIWTNVISILSFYLSLPLLTYSYFLMLNAHSLSRSRHFTTRRYAVLPRGVEGCGSSTTHIPFSDPTRRPPRLTFLTADHRPVSHLSHLSRKRISPLFNPRLPYFDRVKIISYTGTSSFSHWILSDLMTTCRFPSSKKNIIIIIVNCQNLFIHYLAYLQFCFFFVWERGRGGTRLGMSSFLWRQSQFNSGQTKCLILEGGSLFA